MSVESLASQEILLRAASCAVTAIADSQPAGTPTPPGLFEQATGPPLSLDVEDYICRIFMHGLRAEESVLVFGIALLRRVACHIQMTPDNTHEILAVTLLTTSKLNFDRVKGNVYWAKMTGIEIKRLNALEIELLTRLGYRMNTQLAEYEDTVAVLGHVIESES